jgi:hypothetical protein
VLLAALCLLGKPVLAQAAAVLPPDSVTRREIRDAEQLIERAVIDKDTVALDTLYAPDFEWRHWTGEVDTKSTWLGFLRDSVFYTRHTATPMDVQIYTHAVWVSGVLTSQGRYLTTGEFGYTLRYGRLWVSDGTRWRVRQQVSRPVSPAP